MRTALDADKFSSLQLHLLSHLDESEFFAKLSEFFLDHFVEYKVQIFESFLDGSTQLRAENGFAVEDGITYAKGQGLPGYVTRTKRSYYSNNVKRDPLLSTSLRDEVVEAELCVPINSHGSILGTIHIQSDSKERNFGEKDISEVLEILNQLARPVNNMRVYLLAKNLNKELKIKIEQKEKELEMRGNPNTFVSKATYQKVELIGQSKSFSEMMITAKKVAKEDFPVLIIGESGTGKKLLSKFIHQNSNRNEQDYVIAHCNAGNELTLESELFGRGSQMGIFERANGGTVILDSVHELALRTQAKLVKMLISGTINRVDSEVSIPVNVRIISTTKLGIEKLIEEGKFREDLYYRLNIVNIKAPSLRDRIEDIKILSEYFLNAGRESNETKILTGYAVKKLADYNWPGNIQEIKNIMERTFVLADDRFIDEQHLPELAVVKKEEEKKALEFVESTLFDMEKTHICSTLEHLNGNKTRAAKSLGITVKTLYNKLHSYGIQIGRSE